MTHLFLDEHLVGLDLGFALTFHDRYRYVETRPIEATSAISFSWDRI